MKSVFSNRAASVTASRDTDGPSPRYLSECSDLPSSPSRDPLGSDPRRCSALDGMDLNPDGDVLFQYHDGTLNSNAAQVVKQHVHNCKRCASFVDEINETETILRREWVDETPLSPDFIKSATDRILEAIRLSTPH